MSKKHIIKELQERHVAIKVDLMVWSDKMDLLALSNSKGEVALHGLQWNRLWLLEPPSPHYIVRHIAWRPDGRVIAVAYVPNIMKVGESINGEVMLIDVENKDVLHVINVTDDVSCLVWLQEKQAIESQKLAPHKKDPSSYLPKLPSLSRTFGPLPDNYEEYFEDAKRVKDQAHLNFLLIGTCDGNLYLSVFGLFSCGVMNVNKDMSASETGNYTSVLNAEMSPDMKSLFLLVAVDEEKFYADTIKEENGTTKISCSELPNKENIESLEADKEKKHDNEVFEANDKSTHTENNIINECNKMNHNKEVIDSKTLRKRAIKLVILDSRDLSSKSRELHALSLKHGHIISLLDYVEQTMHFIIEAWENIYLLEIESKLSKHAEALPEGTLSADFLELLLFGVPSESLKNFLLTELNDKGIKKLGNSIEISHSNIQKLILKHLLLVVENLAYHLAEMKGMSKLTDRFKALGLEEETVTKAFSAAGAFLIKATEVQRVIDESMKRYKAFFRWLYAIVHRISDSKNPDLTMTDINQQDLNFIADYLYKLDVVTDKDGIKKRHCHLDPLGQYLENKNLTTPGDNEHHNHWQKLLEENPCLKNHFSIIERRKHTSLVQEHDHLKQAIDNVFKTPECAIGNMFKLKTIINIANVPYNRLCMTLVEDHTILVSLIEGYSPDFFQLYKIPVDESSADVKLKLVSFKSEKSVLMKCIDVKFYLPETLSILLEEDDEDRNAVIVQMMTKPVYENVSDTIDGNTLTGSIETKQISNFVASSFAINGLRKLAIVLSESRRKLRLFEMEGEDDDEEEEENSQVESEYNLSEKLIDDIDGCFMIDDPDKTSPYDSPS